MPFRITTTVTCYLLPQDGAQAKADFLKHLMNPGETWITAYAFTLTDMINDLIAAHKAGIPLHIYLDHSQEVGKVEKPLVQQLVSAGVEVTSGLRQRGRNSFVIRRAWCRMRRRVANMVLGRLDKFFAECVAAGKYGAGVFVGAMAR